MSRHEMYYQQRTVPCACGSHNAYWHGPVEGMRVYCCDACWNVMPHGGTEWPDEIEARVRATPVPATAQEGENDG